MDVKALYESVSSGPHDTVTSPDGSAELLIPAGALRAGTSATDIHIGPADSDAQGATLGNASPIAGWSFSPDGLVFQSPVLLVVPSDSLPTGMSAVFMSLSPSNQSVESLPSLSLLSADGTAQSMAAVSHFSDVEEWQVGMMPTLQGPSSAVVNQPFYVYASVAVSGLDPLDDNVHVDPNFSVSGPIREDGSSADSRSIDASFQDSGGFTCTSTGPGEIDYVLDFNYEVVAHYITKNNVDEVISGGAGASLSVMCVAAGTTPPTPSPTPGSSPSVSPTYVPPLSMHVPLLTGFPPTGTPGDAQITPNSDGTMSIDVHTQGSPASFSATINSGGCNGTTATKLNDGSNGESTTTFDETFAALFAGGLSINITAPGSTKSVMCGDIPKAMMIQLGAGSAGDETPATVVLTDFGSMVGVYIDKTVGPSSTGEPANIVSAQCPATGPVAYPLSDVSGGESHSTIQTTLSKLLGGGYSIQVGSSDSTPDQIVVCGDLNP